MKDTKSFNTENLQAFLFQALPLALASLMPVIAPQCPVVTMCLAPGSFHMSGRSATMHCSHMAELVNCLFGVWFQSACLDAYLNHP